MTAIIVQSRTFLTLLGGGSTHFSHLNQSLRRAPILLAADGGANTAIGFDLMPDAVIGDMDSVTDATREKIPADRFHYVAEQDSTDFEKCLQRIDVPLILALGFTGARLDHTLAACTTLSRFAGMRIILVGEEDICFVAPARFEIELPTGTTFSIYPMAETTGTSEGLKYPIDGIEMAPNGRIGTSNAVTGPVKCTFPGARPLIMLPFSALDAVIDVLTAS